MKKLCFWVFMMLVVVGCGTARTAEERATADLLTAQSVSDSIARRSFTIEIDYVSPNRLPSHPLTSQYWLRLKGDTLESFLPYFGVAYRARLGEEGWSPLDFTGPVESFAVSPMKRDGQRIRMVTRRQTDRLTYQLELFSNGRATLYVTSDDRESISFTGNMILAE